MDITGFLKKNGTLNNEITTDIENFNAQLTVSKAQGAEGVEDPELASNLLNSAIDIGVKILLFVRFWKPKWRGVIDVLIGILTAWGSGSNAQTEAGFRPPRPEDVPEEQIIPKQLAAKQPTQTIG